MSRDSFLNRDVPGRGPSHRRSKKQEKELAKKGKGLQVPRSGAGLEKGDIKRYAGVFRVEAKTTQRKSFSVTREMIRKISDAALPHNELPAIVVEFSDQQGRKLEEIAVIPVSALEILGLNTDG